MTDEQLIAELGLDGAPSDLQQRVVEKTRATIELRVITLVGDLIADEQRPQFETLSQQGDGSAVWEWLKSDVVGVDVSEIYEATLKDYIADQKESLL